MKTRSTGLGKTELTMELERLRWQNGHLIFEFRATEPVTWRIRAAFPRKDLFILIRGVLRISLLHPPSVLKMLLKAPPHPGDY